VSTRIQAQSHTRWPPLPRGPHALPPGRRQAIQRDRLLVSIAETVARKGYLDTTVEDVTSRAGISRRTFYELFADKQECFLAACESANRGLEGELERITKASSQPTPSTLLEEILRLSTRGGPGVGTLVAHTLQAGPEAREQRDRALAQMRMSLERAFAGAAPPRYPWPDIAGPLVGGIARYIARSEVGGDELERRLVAHNLRLWLSHYELPEDPIALLPATTPSAGGGGPAAGDSRVLQGALPRSRNPRQERAAALQATATLVYRKGYQGTSVREIVETAGITRGAFNQHFSDKREAFMEVFRHGVRRAMASSARGFAGGENWPERVRASLESLLAHLAAGPEVAHLCLVDAYTVESEGVPRVEDMLFIFTALLEEGYHLESPRRAPPRITTLLVCETLIELLYAHVSSGRTAELPGTAAQMAFIALAPFLGSSAALEAAQGQPGGR
jgi:AcrR family transcriptional regulator